MRTVNVIRVMLVAVLAVCCHACTDREDALPSQPQAKEGVSPNPHAISQEQAMASLWDFLGVLEKGETRSAMLNRKVKDIYPVEYHEDGTRTAEGDAVDCENLLYVVNFEGNQGFAILAADDRVEDDVLAVVENGNLSPQVMKAVSNNMTLQRPIVSGFPLTGAYYIKASDDSDEMCMNPNTVDLADTIKAEGSQSLDVDTIVGNFDPDSAQVTYPKEIEKEYNEQEPLVDLNGEYIGGMLYDKARADLVDPKMEDGEDNCHNGNSGSTAGSSQGNTRKVVTSTSWSAVNASPVLLRSYCSWGQGSPFNDLYHIRRNLLIGKKKKRADAGCFPLAIAKIFTLHRYPDIFIDNGVTVDWEALQRPSNLGSETGKSSAAHLLWAISQGCGSRYFYHGTFTRPKKAMSYLRRNGFENVKSHEYEFGRVKTMIDKKYPVLIYACPRYNVFKSHCWNIDGYQVMRRTVTTKVYNNLNKVISESAQQETRNVVHCDFGWRGHFNGYYASGVFRLNDKDAIYDDSQFRPYRNTHYNTIKQIVTYDIPNR